jgi:hypothetical protein
MNATGAMEARQKVEVLQEKLRSVKKIEVTPESIGLVSRNAQAGIRTTLDAFFFKPGRCLIF